MRSLLFIAVALVGFGCADPFAEAQKLDTPEAYEKYLVEYPDGAFALQARLRVEELMFEKAQQSKSLDDFDAYLARFPKGTLREKAMDVRRQSLFDWADTTDTAQSWDKYMSEYPSGNRKLMQQARKRKRMATWRDKLQISTVTQEQVNLAENPDGPLDGWGFWVDVTNGGEWPIETLTLRIIYLDLEGNGLASNDWPVVSERLPGNLPKPEGFSDPIKPDAKRTWEWTTGDLPAGWSKKVRVKPVDIKWVGRED